VRLEWARACAAATLLAVALTGCARYYWSKPGAVVEQFDRDNMECARESSANPTEAAHGIVNMSRYRACLETRRWVRSKEFDPPPIGFYRGFE
jgi:hypothetical protein